MSHPVVELVGAYKTYPGSPPVTALTPTNLQVENGQATAIVGPSGSGKSTLLSLLGTLDAPTGGDVIVDGFRTAKLKKWQQAALRGTKLGFVFQQFHLLPRLTAEENVEVGLFYAGIPPRQRQKLSRAALTEVGLEDRMRHRPGQMSGGEQQRVAIARALVRRPAVLFADEPTGALDSNTGQSVIDLLMDTAKQGTAVVVVTHDLSIAKRFGRRLHVLDGVVHEELAAEGRLDAKV